MPNFNQVTLVGHLTRDVELKYTANGNAVADVGIAVNDFFKDEKKAMFIDLVLWKEKAETFAQYVKKGDPVLVSGKLQLDQWETDQGRRSKHKVNVFTFQFLKGKGDGQGDGPQDRPSARAPAPKTSRDDEDVDMDSIPF